MDLILHKNNFKKLKEFESKLPAISIAFDILKLLHEYKKNILLKKNSTFDDAGVMFYDFVDNTFDEYCFNSLNSSLRYIYNEFIINQKLLSTKLYWLFYDILDDLIKTKKYKFLPSYDLNDVLNKLFRCLRLSRKNDITKYFVHEILFNFILQILEISNAEFHSLMYEFFLILSSKNILSFLKTDNSIAFNPKYFDDLKTLNFLSFDLIFLGEHKNLKSFDFTGNKVDSILELYLDNYNLNDEYIHLLTNDLIITNVIACTVDKVSYQNSINNIFIEKIANGITTK